MKGLMLMFVMGLMCLTSFGNDFESQDKEFKELKGPEVNLIISDFDSEQVATLDVMEYDISYEIPILFHKEVIQEDIFDIHVIDNWYSENILYNKEVKIEVNITDLEFLDNYNSTRNSSEVNIE